MSLWQISEWTWCCFFGGVGWVLVLSHIVRMICSYWAWQKPIVTISLWPIDKEMQTHKRKRRVFQHLPTQREHLNTSNFGRCSFLDFVGVSSWRSWNNHPWNDMKCVKFQQIRSCRTPSVLQFLFNGFSCFRCGSFFGGVKGCPCTLEIPKERCGATWSCACGTKGEPVAKECCRHGDFEMNRRWRWTRNVIFHGYSPEN